MISDKYKCIHIHIPRTGGSSIESAIWPDPRSEDDLWMGFIDKHSNKYQTDGLQHLTALNISKEVGKRFDEYWKFTIVRNPWDKMVSEWLYLKNKKRLMEFLGLKKYVEFKKFIELAKKKPHTHWEKQVNFIKDKKGRNIVDFIGRFENYSEETIKIMEKLGIGTKVLHKNRSPKRQPYQFYYDSEAIDMVRDAYKEDIKEFGYKYEA